MNASIGLLLIGAAVFPPGPARAPLPAATCAADEVEDAVQAILDEHRAAIAAFQKAYRAAATDEERSKLYEETYPAAEDYAPRLWKLVEANPAHAGVAEALGWLFGNDPAQAERAAELLLEHHIESEYVANVCLSLVHRTHGARPALERVLASSELPEVKGLATLCLGQYLIGMADEAEKAQEATEEQRDLLAERVGLDALIEWMDSDPALLREEGTKLLERVQAEYADVAHPYGGTLGPAAEGFLFELRHLQLGMIAPNIEGEDIEGTTFKLSDYRGKVVVLDFWGHW